MLARRTFGRTGLQVSVISLGTVELGLDYGIAPQAGEGRPDDAEAARLLHRALDLGINLIDTARAYGESERRIGSALKHRRGEYVLASKVPTFRAENLSGNALRARAAASIRESLAALRTDAIDIMMIHAGAGEAIAGGEVSQALDDARRAGLVRFTGASVYGPEDALAAIRCGEFDCLEIAYSLLDRRAETAVLAAAAEAGVGIIVRSVLLKGALTHRYKLLPEELSPVKATVKAAMAAAGVTVEGLPELAYRYVLGNPLTHTALVGTRHAGEMEAAVAYASRGPLPRAVAESLRALPAVEERWLNPGNWP
ncbi:MAG TPA: aldo/keto reductase [Bryobacteraceae bacterium]|nr:aldo/keto reductase [Bryobacteraceae bacterium]